MTPQDLIDDLRSRINTAYAEQVGTESWERRLCVEALEAQADEIERLRAEITMREDGAERMALKGIEMRAEIQRLINERNAFGLAIDRAISGSVPDEYPLRSRLVEIAAMRAEIDEIKQVEFPRRVQKVADGWRGKVEALKAEIERQKARYALLEESYSLLRTEIESMKRQKPAAWMCPDDPDSATAFSWRPVACELACCLKRRVPLYLAPGAQENNDAPHQ